MIKIRNTSFAYSIFFHFLLFLLGFGQISQAQSPYTSWFTGNSSNVDIQANGGIVLMGGAGEHDAAMQWFLERCNGGDVVVIRTSGSDGYNDYLFTELGIDVNSVETLLLPNQSASDSPYVLEQIRNAEAIWMAGGDQSTYLNLWKDKPVELAIKDALANNNAVIGGISAGMAVLGDAYFSASNGTVYSDEALENPYNVYMTLGYGDFFNFEVLKNTITDTHFDDPDRRGRLVSFIARLSLETGNNYRAIACDEYTAVCIDENNRAICFGESPAYDENVYFIQFNCSNPQLPEICEPEQNLNWYNEGNALSVYKIPAQLNGSQFFDLNDWKSGEGGNWENWSVNNANLEINSAAENPCELLNVENLDQTIKLNYLDGKLIFSALENVVEINIFNSLGQNIQVIKSHFSSNEIHQIKLKKTTKISTLIIRFASEKGRVITKKILVN